VSGPYGSDEGGYSGEGSGGGEGGSLLEEIIKNDFGYNDDTDLSDTEQLAITFKGLFEKDSTKGGVFEDKGKGVFGKDDKTDDKDNKDNKGKGAMIFGMTKSPFTPGTLGKDETPGKKKDGGGGGGGFYVNAGLAIIVSLEIASFRNYMANCANNVDTIFGLFGTTPDEAANAMAAFPIIAVPAKASSAMKAIASGEDLEKLIPEAESLMSKASSFTTRQLQMLKDNKGFNVSPESWFSEFKTIGRNGTFITDGKAIKDVIGDFAPGSYKLDVATTAKLEKALGLKSGSLSDGFRITEVNGIRGMAPRSPISGDIGNPFFLGAGKGLPGGGPEMIIEPIPTGR
jgi:hypothetical protein